MPEQLSKLYDQVALEIVPSYVRMHFENDPVKVEEAMKKWEDNQYTKGLPFDEFIERFRFSPKNPDRYPNWVPHEQLKLSLLLSTHASSQQEEAQEDSNNNISSDSNTSV